MSHIFLLSSYPLPGSTANDLAYLIPNLLPDEPAGDLSLLWPERDATRAEWGKKCVAAVGDGWWVWVVGLC